MGENMKLGFLIPVLDEIDISSKYQAIENSCKEENTEFEIIFVLNGDLTNFFTKIRTEFKDNNLVKVIKIDKVVNQHKLITVGMPYCEDYDATIIYSSKEEAITSTEQYFSNSIFIPKLFNS